LCILYNITNSWLLSSTGFDFNILWRDSENQEFFCAELFFKGQGHAIYQHRGSLPINGLWPEASCWLHLANLMTEKIMIMKCLNIYKLFLCGI